MMECVICLAPLAAGGDTFVVCVGLVEQALLLTLDKTQACTMGCARWDVTQTLGG